MNHFKSNHRSRGRFGAVILVAALGAMSIAGEVFTRAELQTILGPGSIVDTFEGANLDAETQIGANQNLEYNTVLANSATHVVSNDSQYTSEVGLFLQNILGASSTNLGAYGLQTVHFFPSGLTPAVGLDLAVYNFVGQVSGTLRFKRFGVEVGAVAWNFAGITPRFFGWHDPLGIDEVVIEPGVGTYPPLIDDVEFKVMRPAARPFYSLDMNGNNLVTIDPVNGHVEVVGSLGQTGIIDADLTWFNDYLYAAVVQAVGPSGNWQSRLFKIDPQTGAVIDIHSLAPVDNYLDYVEGIAVANGRLIISTQNQYGFGSYASDALWDVNPATGLLTNLHSYRPNDFYADMDCLEGLPSGVMLTLDNEPGSYKRYIQVGSGPYFYNIIGVSYNNRASVNDWVLDGQLLVGPNDYTDAVVTFDVATGNLLHSVSTGQGNYRGAALPPSNEPPVSTDDFYVVDQLGTLAEADPGILVNDSDPDNEELTVELISGPSHASSFTQNANGSFSYTPTAYFYGSDTYTYRVFDGTAYSEPATVHITVLRPGANGHINGGGNFYQDGARRTFGLQAKVKSNGTVEGNLEFQDHALGLNVKSTNVTWVYSPSPRDGYFSGACKMNGQTGFTFFVEVHDLGEPGTADSFFVWVFDSNNNVVYSSGGGLATGGNIQIH